MPNNIMQIILDQFAWKVRNEEDKPDTEYKFKRKVLDAYIHEGDDTFQLLDGLGFTEVPVARNKHIRWMMIDDDLMTTITYCEGDLILCVHETFPSYGRDLMNAEEFYRHN